MNRDEGEGGFGSISALPVEFLVQRI